MVKIAALVVLFLMPWTGQAMIVERDLLLDRPQHGFDDSIGRLFINLSARMKNCDGPGPVSFSDALMETVGDTREKHHARWQFLSFNNGGRYVERKSHFRNKSET